MEPTCDLWSLSKSGGCAAKLSAAALHALTEQLHPRRDPRLLVGIETSDDAAIYALTDDLGLVLTADFITPVFTDPFLFGQVAAANALSDVYAMGGRPVAVLNLCCFPERGVDPGVLGAVLQGGLSKTEEAGAVLAGGHTVRDNELKYGLSVTGLVHPRRFTPNSGARAGDLLILTKPLGTGVQISAGKQGLIAEARLRTVVERMAVLNRTACETMMEFEAAGCTDVTGFGLAGHALGLARASRVALRIRSDALPTYPGTREFLDRGVTTGATASNGASVTPHVRFDGRLSEMERRLVLDPQTSGGLLIPIRARDADALTRSLRERGVGDAAVVGECVASDDPRIEIIKD